MFHRTSLIIRATFLWSFALDAFIRMVFTFNLFRCSGKVSTFFQIRGCPPPQIPDGFRKKVFETFFYSIFQPIIDSKKLHNALMWKNLLFSCWNIFILAYFCSQYLSAFISDCILKRYIFKGSLIHIKRTFFKIPKQFSLKLDKVGKHKNARPLWNMKHFPSYHLLLKHAAPNTELCKAFYCVPIFGIFVKHFVSFLSISVYHLLFCVERTEVCLKPGHRLWLRPKTLPLPHLARLTGRPIAIFYRILLPFGQLLNPASWHAQYYPLACSKNAQGNFQACRRWSQILYYSRKCEALKVK